jgi:hypothetical protein
MEQPLYNVQGIVFKYNQMVLKVNGIELEFDLSDVSQRLAGASAIEREKYEISPSGYGIHWPLIDEDLSIPGLLKTAKISLDEVQHITSMAG